MKADFQKGTKVCSCCRQELPISEFYKKKSQPDGLNCYCKKCADLKKSERLSVIKNIPLEERIIKEFKVCSCCGRELSIDNFGKSKTHVDGRSGYCKECANKSAAESRDKNRERNRELSYEGKIVCSVCGEEKERSKFYVHRTSSTGFDCICKECRSKQAKETYKDKKDYYKQQHIEYRLSGRLKQWKQNKLETDIVFKMKQKYLKKLRDSIREYFLYGWKRNLDFLGCSIPDLIIHIESQFKDGMTWENRGNGKGKWNIDHIIPLSYFCQEYRDNIEEGMSIANHYLNLQPLWEYENMEKRSTLPSDYLERINKIKLHKFDTNN